MSTIKKDIKVNIKRSTAVLTGLFITCSAISTAHSELVIQEKDPVSSIINQYAGLENTNLSLAQTHQLITVLNQRVASNPKDSLAWEALAHIYSSNGYHAYAVYAASEAIELGLNTTKLKKILLNSSAIVSETQLQAGYLTDDVDEEFLKEYQYALSKIYGEVYGFNYDESLPKPPAPIVRPKKMKVKSVSKSRSVASTRKVQPRVKRKSVTRPKAKPVSKTTPVNKPVNRPTTKNSRSNATDPFKILR